MKKSFPPSAIAAVLFATALAWACFSSRPAAAQPPAVQGVGRIGLIDINLILKNHVRLKAQLAELTKKMDVLQKQFEEQIKKVQDEEQNQLRLYKVGSPDYTQLEERIASEKANIQAQIGMKRKEWMQQQAALYAGTYEEVHADVNAFCARNGYILVLNFDSDGMHADSPDNVIRSIAKPVVAYDRSMDITPILMPRYVQQPQADNRNLGSGFPQR